MRRPPANGAPPLAVWQDTQSPARARYSPRSMSDCDDALAAPARSSVAISVRVMEAPGRVRDEAYKLRRRDATQPARGCKLSLLWDDKDKGSHAAFPRSGDAFRCRHRLARAARGRGVSRLGARQAALHGGEGARACARPRLAD